MFRKIEDFNREWKYETESTLKLFKVLDDKSLNFKINDKVRTIGNLAWHIANSPVEILSHSGLDLSSSGIDHKAEAPKTVAELVKIYETASKIVFDQIALWKDEQLEDLVPMYGEQWKKGTILSVLIRHQAHHRGQLTILMRMQNIPVTGVYGPAYEEWALMGMTPEK